MTKREAIEKCRAMWEWIAKNPEKEKEDYFSEVYRVNTRPFHKTPLYNNCFECQYVIDLNHDTEVLDCTKCFLLGLWMGSKRQMMKEAKDIIESGQAPCVVGKNSPYRKWIDASVVRYFGEVTSRDLKNQSVYAKQIVNYCTKLLKKKGGNNVNRGLFVK